MNERSLSGCTGPISRVKIAIGLVALGLFGCAMGVNRSFVHEELEKNSPLTVAVLPFENLSNSPTAGLSVAQLFATELMASKQFCLLEESEMRRQLIGLKVDMDRLADVSIARDVGTGLFVDAVLTGSVSEFSYQHGLREEPAVGFNVQLVRIRDGVVLWRASQSLMGSGFLSRESIYYTAQKAVHNTVGKLSKAVDAKKESMPKEETVATAPPSGQVTVGRVRGVGRQSPGNDAGTMHHQQGDPVLGELDEACAKLFEQRSLLMKKGEEERRAKEKALAKNDEKPKKENTIDVDILELSLPPK
ncbi:MAG: hypothetical protein HQL75_02180 [Magnetococcales bacterium]|nr:hypothetical protein [Magnetococcales bacterium]